MNGSQVEGFPYVVHFGVLKRCNTSSGGGSGRGSGAGKAF